MAFCLLILFSTKGPTYDEPWYLRTIELLRQHGLGVRFIALYPGSAGPLYAVVQDALSPLTHLSMPGVRLVNVAFLVATSLLLVGCLRLIRVPGTELAGLDLACIPGIGVPACLSLTEMPAMAFATASLLALLVGLRHTRQRAVAVPVGILGGLLLGIAILGRQPYLLVILPLGFLLLDDFRGRAAVVAGFAVSALLICLPVFITWGGLLPRPTAYVGAGLMPGHGILACAYGTVMMLVLAPRFFVMPRRVALTVIAASVALNALTGWVRIVPLARAMAHLLSPSMMPAYAATVSALFVGAGILFVVATVRNCLERRDERTFVFCAATMLLILAGCARITMQLSSRYVVVAAPFLLISAAYFSRPTGWKALRLGAGSAISIVATYSYLYLR